MLQPLYNPGIGSAVRSLLAVSHPNPTLSSLWLFCARTDVYASAGSDDFAAYCLILPLLGIGPEWWMDSHNIHHVVCNDVQCGEGIAYEIASSHRG